MMSQEKVITFPTVGAFAESSQRRAAEVTEPTSRSTLNGGGPGDTSGGMTDDWKTDVNRQLGQLHTDVRSLLNRGVTAVVALALMVGGLYLYTNQKFDTLNQRLAAIEVQQAAILGKIELLLDRKESKRN